MASMKVTSGVAVGAITGTFAQAKHEVHRCVPYGDAGAPRHTWRPATVSFDIIPPPRRPIDGKNITMEIS